MVACAALLLGGGCFLKVSVGNIEKGNIAFSQSAYSIYDFLKDWEGALEAWNDYYTIKWVYNVYSSDITIYYSSGQRYATGSVTYKRMCDVVHNEEDECSCIGIIEYGTRTYNQANVTNYHGVGV